MPRKSSHFLRVERATKVEARDLAREIDLLRGFVLGLTLFSPPPSLPENKAQSLRVGFTFGFCSE